MQTVLNPYVLLTTPNRMIAELTVDGVAAQYPTCSFDFIPCLGEHKVVCNGTPDKASDSPRILSMQDFAFGYAAALKAHCSIAR